MRDNLLDYLKALPSRAGSGDVIDGDTPLIASGILDSLNLFTLVAFIDERFGIEIDLDDIEPENFATVDSIVALLDRYRTRAE